MCVLFPFKDLCFKLLHSVLCRRPSAYLAQKHVRNRSTFFCREKGTVIIKIEFKTTVIFKLCIHCQVHLKMDELSKKNDPQSSYSFLTKSFLFYKMSQNNNELLKLFSVKLIFTTIHLLLMRPSNRTFFRSFQNMGGICFLSLNVTFAISLISCYLWSFGVEKISI